MTRALTILSGEFDLSTTGDQETLGLAGAIYNRRWDVDGNKLHLERSLEYCRRGFELGIEPDGYSAINAAFMQDLLAYLEEKQAIETGSISMTAGARTEDARGIRRAAIDSVAPGFEEQSGANLATGDYWAVATLAEACLGLQKYDEAKHWLAIASAIPGIAEWEYESTAGIQKNALVRILANPLTNLKMIFKSSYSRTQRLGELYEELIYSRVQDGDGAKERWLNDLLIRPVDEAADFNPRRDNWARRCKIPQLVLNATTLNSGHNWQFTASWMGESPVNIDTDVDSNKRYRRLYYSDAPQGHQKVRLGTAVGASSCVPGLITSPSVHRHRTGPKA